MPVSFLTATQRANYGRYASIPTPEELARYFHLDDADRALIATKRGEHNRLGFALQLTTVRFLGTFLDDLTTLPEVVIHTVSKQLGINDRNALSAYDDNRQRWAHTTEIRTRFGYREFVDPSVGFRLTADFHSPITLVNYTYIFPIFTGFSPALALVSNPCYKY